jgi:hypothetical protein
MRETCGGFYCFETAEEVFRAIVPRTSALREADRVVLVRLFSAPCPSSLTPSHL